MSRIIVRIPTPLRGFSGGAAELAAQGETVSEVLSDLGRQHQELVQRLLDDRGELRHFVNLYIGSRNIRALEGLQTRLTTDSVLSIIPAVAGGEGALS